MKLICFLILITSCINAFGYSLYGHRGARGLAPENTLPGYQAAINQGVNFVDMDVMMTKDHIVVAHHDYTLNPDITRTAGGKWIEDNDIYIKNLTLKQLKAYDVGRIKPDTRYAQMYSQQQPADGTPVPTLKQVIQYVKTMAGDKVGFQIEIKTDPTKPDATHTPEEMAAAVAKIIEEEDIVERTQVQAYDWRCLVAIQKIDPKIATAYITDKDQEDLMNNDDPETAGLWTAGKLLQDYHNSIPQMIKAMGGKYWDPQDTTVTAERIKEAHRLGLKVVAWTWPERSGKEVDAAQVKRLISIGIDGIITDRPDVVKAMTKTSEVKSKVVKSAT